MAAGAIAGIMEHTVMYPVDAIKTRMQVAGASAVYRGIFSSINTVCSTEGALALWRGMGSVILGAGPAHAVYFGVYETVTNIGQKDGHNCRPSPTVSAAAGVAATVSSDALMTPFDVIKQRMQVRNGDKSMLRTAINVYRAEGFGAFYISYPITLLMNVPFAAVNFAVYDSVSHFLNPQRHNDPLVHCISGGLAGGSAAAVSTPFDVVKTLLQTRGVTSDERARALKSVRNAFVYVYQTNGLRGFTRGIQPRVLAFVPATAVSWTVYEMAKHYINQSAPIIA